MTYRHPTTAPVCQSPPPPPLPPCEGNPRKAPPFGNRTTSAAQTLLDTLNFPPLFRDVARYHIPSDRRWSHFLGTSRREEAATLPNGRCSSAASEEQLFRSVCAPVITSLDAYLAHADARRRGLLIRFTRMGQNAFGWGHALPAAFALHWLCYRVRRRCHLELLDFDLGYFWAYANGDTWGLRAGDSGTPAELRQRYGRGQVAKIEVAHAPWDVPGGLANLSRALLEHSAPLVELSFRSRIPLGSDMWLSALPLRSASAGIDRCFCRYVSHPRFLSALPSPIVAPAVAYHFRTSFADVPDAVMHVANEPACAARPLVRAASKPGAWVGPVCGRGRATAFDPQGYVMSDAPGFIQELLSQHPTLRANPLQLPAANTRSWSVGRGRHGRSNHSVLHFLAADYYLAGLAAEVQETMASSFSRALVARSVCVRRTAFINEAKGACPAFQIIFWRDMHLYFDTGNRRHAYSCWRESLVDDHPCKQLASSHDCRDAFVSAMRSREPPIIS